MTDDTIVVRKASLRPVDMNGQLAMLNEDTGKYVVLNEVGALIWDLAVKPVSIHDIVSRLTDEFDITRDECANQVIFYLDKLKKERLLDIIKR